MSVVRQSLLPTSSRAIVVFPSIEDMAPILPLRQRFDPLADLVPPHLTLVFPFQDPCSESELQSHVEEAVCGIPPFRIRLAEITGSENEYLFLNVKEGNDAIIALHDRLYTGLLRRHLSLAHTFTPHLTVGRLPNRDAFAEALAAASTYEVRIETMCREVAVYRIGADGARDVENVVRLT